MVLVMEAQPQDGQRNWRLRKGCGKKKNEADKAEVEVRLTARHFHL
jgi:hypothetical protein